MTSKCKISNIQRNIDAIDVKIAKLQYRKAMMEAQVRELEAKATVVGSVDSASARVTMSQERHSSRIADAGSGRTGEASTPEWRRQYLDDVCRCAKHGRFDLILRACEGDKFFFTDSEVRVVGAECPELVPYLEQHGLVKRSTPKYCSTGGRTNLFAGE